MRLPHGWRPVTRARGRMGSSCPTPVRSRRDEVGGMDGVGCNEGSWNGLGVKRWDRMDFFGAWGWKNGKMGWDGVGCGGMRKPPPPVPASTAFPRQPRAVFCSSLSFLLLEASPAVVRLVCIYRFPMHPLGVGRPRTRL